ncbi:hypothetical protein D6858_12770 [Tsuneonella suprasediminis]|uniref:Uncharacterized protein n=1 Tax=Tsuneonella suprasediminis TaxID=2306996 RepID=A0A419QZH2_9SPHN|nr:hypothetical protein [Tsuneonella suprasediminis]RJX66379.1 hypothetical protein D6858_12770 [Tsuneonella suprasediminis]
MRKPLRANVAPATLMPANNALAGITDHSPRQAIAKTLRECRRTVSALAALSPTISHHFPVTACARS